GRWAASPTGCNWPPSCRVSCCAAGTSCTSSCPACRNAPPSGWCPGCGSSGRPATTPARTSRTSSTPSVRPRTGAPRWAITARPCATQNRRPATPNCTSTGCRRPGCRRCTCTASTTVAPQRITAAGCSACCPTAAGWRPSPTRDTSCSSSSPGKSPRISSISSAAASLEAMGRLAAVDAQTYWMAATIPSDQFLLYAFAGPVPDVPAVVRALRERARRCPDFRLRIQDRGPGYPRWVRGDVAAQQTVVHPVPGRWADLLDAVARLVDDQLDPRAMAWRLHVFPEVEDIPGGGDGVVAVLQVAHALADGVRSLALAAWLFGRDTPVAPVAPPRPLEPLALPLRACRAARTHRQLVRDTTTGVVAPPPDSCPVLSCNNRPEGRRRIRTVVRPRVRIPGPTVTVGVLAAV